MKKLFIFAFFTFFLLTPFFTLDAQITQGGWTCIEGLPRTDFEWAATPDTDYYKIYRNGQYVTSVNKPGTQYVDSTVGYRTYYRYEIRSFRYPDIQTLQATQAVDITTGTCGIISSLTGPTSLNVGQAGTYAATFIADSYQGNTSYTMWECPPVGDCLWFAGGSSSISGNANFTQEGTWTIMAELMIPYPSFQQPLQDRKFISVNVTKQLSDRLVTVNGKKTETINSGEYATIDWTASGVSRCDSLQTSGPATISQLTTTIPVTNNAASSSASIRFNTPTAGTPYTINLSCPPAPGFAFGDGKKLLASEKEGFGAFLNFVKIAYAATTNPDEAYVYVNALPKPVLSVNAVMYPDVPGGPTATSVAISGSQTGTSGTTSYTISNLASISTTLTAAEPATGKIFMDWSNCDSKNDVARTCTVAVSAGDARTVTASYGPAPVQLQPDLIISSLTVPSSVNYGATVSFTAVVKNNGAASAGSSVTWGQIDYDSNGSWDYNLVPDQNTGVLIAGATETEQFSWVTTRSGTHKIKICADKNNMVTESNEANNCSTSLGEYSFTVGSGPIPPIVEVATLNVRSTPVTGVTITRVNVGPSDIGGTTNYTKSYTENFNTVIQAPLTAPNGASFTGWTGCTSAVSQNCNVDVNVTQEKTVTANYTSAPSGSKPNFEVAGGIGISPSSPTAGQSVTFSATIRNSGEGAGPYNLVSNLFIDEGNDGNTDRWEYTLPKTTGSLEPGATKLETWTSAWTAKVGTHRIRICPDIPNYIEETNENDNCAVDVLLTVQQGTFSYSLSNTNRLTIDKSTGVGQKVITLNLISGSPQSVSLSLSGLPNGVSYAPPSPTLCMPTCSSTITFSVLPSTVNGTYSITVTGTPPGSQLVFPLRITGDAMSITCVPEPAVTFIGQPVTWTASVTGGRRPYKSFIWSGTGIPTNPAPNANPYTLTYSTIGVKTANVTVTDAASSTAQCVGASTAQINFDPKFEEF